MNPKRTSREDVISAYQVMLGRDPESEQAVASHIQDGPTVLDLVRNISASEEFARRVGRGESSSPFFHFNASIDVRAIVESHLNGDRKPLADCYVNFLGVAMPIEAMPHIGDRAGQLDPIPIPANYHADMAEWAAALRAVDLARETFAMIELGCGWGCWMANTGVAAKARGLRIHVAGIEGDEKHLGFARKTMEINQISPDEYSLHHGIAAARGGYALFPSQQGEERWGAQPKFDVSEAESEKAVATGKFDRLRMVPLAEAMGDHSKVDLLHMDIQGGEATVVEQSLDLLGKRVGYLVIGTHSRSIEGRLMDLLLGAGWKLEIERPVIFQIIEGRPATRVDGVQGWINPALLQA